MTDKDTYTGHTDRILPRLLSQEYHNSHDLSKTIELYQEYIKLVADLFHHDHDNGSLLNILGLTNVMHNILMKEQVQEVYDDAKELQAMTESESHKNAYIAPTLTVRSRPDDNHDMAIVVGYVTEMQKPFDFGKVSGTGMVRNMTVSNDGSYLTIDYITSNHGTVTYTYPYLKQKIQQEFGDNSKYIFEAIKAYYRYAGVMAFLYDEKYYGPIVRGMALEGFAYTKRGMNNNPITGEIEYPIYSTIKNVTPIRMRNKEHGEFAAYEVTFKRSGNLENLVNRYPKDKKLIEQYFPNTKDIVSAVVYYCNTITNVK